MDQMHSTGMSHDNHISASQNIAPEFQNQLSQVVHAAGMLSDAFVSEDAAKIDAAVNEVRNKLNEADMNLLKGEDHMNWMQYQRSMIELVNKISDSSELSEQKESFAAFNENLYLSVNAFGIQGEPAYYQFCPMAFNNKGAYWFSNMKKINNPYFGEKMLTCGQTREVFE